ncbi:hypothetical protein DYB28_012778, partial [Aphanomyces astaci]
PFVGTPLDELRPLAYTLWKTDFLPQATSRDLAEFYSTKDYVPQCNCIDALNISKMYLELDQVEHSELYVVDPTLSSTDRNARLAEIKARTTANQREVIAREATKKLANQRNEAHTFLVSAISTNLRRLAPPTSPPSSLTFGPLFGVLLPIVSNERLLWVTTALPLPFNANPACSCHACRCGPCTTTDYASRWLSSCYERFHYPELCSP